MDMTPYYKIKKMSPQLLVTDINRSIEFYTKKLGFDLDFRYDDFYSTGTCPSITEAVPYNDYPELKTLNVSAYTNPFNKEINFRFVSPVSGKARLELFDILGRQLAVVFEGDINASIVKNINYKPVLRHSRAVIYRLTVGDLVAKGSLIATDRERN